MYGWGNGGGESNGPRFLKVDMEEGCHSLGCHQPSDLAMVYLRWAGVNPALNGNGPSVVNKGHLKVCIVSRYWAQQL